MRAWLHLAGCYALAIGVALIWRALGWPEPLICAAAVLVGLIWIDHAPEGDPIGAASPGLEEVNHALDAVAAETASNFGDGLQEHH